MKDWKPRPYRCPKCKQAIMDCRLRGERCHFEKLIAEKLPAKCVFCGRTTSDTGGRKE